MLDGHLLKEIAEFFASNSWMFFCCLFILIYGFCLRYIIKIQLSQVSSEVIQALSYLNSQDSKSWVVKLKDFGEKTRKIPKFRVAWLLFQDQLATCFQKIPTHIHPSRYSNFESQSILFKTPDPRDFFNLKNFLARKNYFHEFIFSSEVFIYLALLGSSLLLLSGFYLVQISLEQGLFISVHLAFAFLLKIIMLAIFLLLVGFLFRFLFNISIRQDYKKLEKEISKWNRSLSKNMPTINRDKWQVYQASESQKQSEVLYNIKEAILEKNINLERKNTEVLKSCMKDLVSEVIKSLKTDLLPLNNHLEKFNTHSKKSCDLMFETQKYLNEGSLKIRMQFNQSLDAMSKHAIMLNTHFENLSDLFSTVKKVSNDLFLNHNKYQKILESLLKSSQQINNSVQQLEIIQKETSGNLSSYVEQTKDIDKRLEVVLKKSHKNLENYSLRLKQYTTNIDRHTARSLRFFGQAIGSLNILLKGIPKASALVLKTSGSLNSKKVE